MPGIVWDHEKNVTFFSLVKRKGFCVYLSKGFGLCVRIRFAILHNTKNDVVNGVPVDYKRVFGFVFL